MQDMIGSGGSGGLVLERSRPLRLFTLFILYVGQGLPIGLHWFAIPAWMAVNGAAVADVGSVAALTALPWSLKLANGFIMDRYTWLPMGRRRIWIMGAQLVMIAALLIAALINPSVTDVAVLGAIGFAVNMATTFQDVAVDGLAVDVMTEDERSRGSGMMFGGQAIGIAIGTAVCGFAINEFGAPTAFTIVSVLIGLLCLYIASFKERDGEKSLPWSTGSAHPRNLSIQLEEWWPLLKSTFKSLTMVTSLLWMPVLFSRGILYGGLTGATPLIGANYTGWDVLEISALTSTAGLVAGILGMTLGGFLGDKLGAKRTAIAWMVAQLIMCAVMYLSVPYWSDGRLFMTFVYAWISLDILLTVACLPISMRLCDPKVAATQFTIYMALANFGISFGAFMLGRTDALGGLQSIFLIVAAGVVVALALMLTVKYPWRAAFDAETAQALPHDGSIKPRVD